MPQRLLAPLGLICLATACSGANIAVNPGFESGTTGWFPVGNFSLSSVTTTPHSGLRAARCTARTDLWNGPGQDMRSLMSSGTTYRLSAWARISGAAAAPVQLLLKQSDAGGDNWTVIGQATASSNAWTEITGYHTLATSGTLNELTLYVQGPAAGIELFVDDASVEPRPEWRAGADARIEQLRKSNVTITVLSSTGAPVSGAAINAQQTRRGFPFGSAMVSSSLTNAAYTSFFKQYFTWGAHTWEAKWYWNEFDRGVENYAQTDAIANFFEANNIRIRGHNLFWEDAGNQPGWAHALSNADLLAEMQGRLNSAVTRYKGRFAQWDVNNEMLHGSFFQSRFGQSIWTWMYQQAHALDPAATLFVNDFDVIASTLTVPYIQQIQALLAAGAPIGGIGAQGHFSRNTMIPAAILDRLDMLAALGLPIWITELEFNDADPARRAQMLEDGLCALYSHSAVKGIVFWDFWAPAQLPIRNSDLMNADTTLNAAGQRLVALLNEWTTHATGPTAADGRYTFRGFQGTYTITVTPPGGAAIIRQLEVPLDATTAQLTISLAPPGGSCPGDINADRVINGSDLSVLLGQFGQAVPAGSGADFNADSRVNGSDLSVLLARFGTSCGP